MASTDPSNLFLLLIALLQLLSTIYSWINKGKFFFIFVIFRELAKLTKASNCQVAQTLTLPKKIKMSQDKQHMIFPEMPEQPDMSDMPIILVKPKWSWCPSREVLLMVIIPILVLLLAVVGTYTWSRYDFYGMDQIKAELENIWQEQPTGLERLWEQLKMLWQWKNWISPKAFEF